MVKARAVPTRGGSARPRTELNQKQQKDPRSVMVVHGRNSHARDALFDFLRTIDLKPLEWDNWVAETRHGSPYIGDILETAFERAQAVVVLLTPDDVACLRPEFHLKNDGPIETNLTGQARPNVLIEAGMALIKDQRRTILVQLGDVRPVSDVFGRHVIMLDNHPQCRNTLATRLENAGCPVSKTGRSWLTKGNFALQHPSSIDALVAISGTLQSSAYLEHIRPIVAEAAVEKVAPSFERLQKAIDDISVHGVKVIEKLDRYLDPANRGELIPETNYKADLQQRLQGGDFKAVYNEVESIPRDDKAERYKEIAGLCVEIDDKFNAFKAANRYLELSDKGARVYRFLGYIYWWFDDIDTAIVHTEHALQIARALKDSEKKAEIVRETQNNLAFYYAEKEINKDEAFSFAESSIKNLSEEHKNYTHFVDTVGYVYLKFGTTEDEMDKAEGNFRRVLDTAPENQDALYHLQEALINVSST